MNKVRKKIRQALASDFLKNIGKMMSGTGFAHLIGIIMIPALTRIYTPGEIGVYAAFLSVSVICYSVASLRFEYATLIPKSDYAANNISVLAILTALSSSFLVLVLLVLFGNTIADLLNIQKLGRLIYLIPFSMFAFSLFMILSFSLNRYRRYGAIAGGKITISTTMAIGQIGLGLMQLKQTGLVIGKVASDLLGVIFLIWHRQKLDSSIRAGVSPRRMKLMALRYKNFPLYNAPHALTTTASSNFPVLLFNSFVSEAIAGFYSMAIKALYSPVRVVAQAGYQVFSQRISEKYGNRERLIPFMKSTVLLLVGSGFLPFLVLFWISPPFFTWFLGPAWEMTGLFVRILTPYIFLVFIVTPLNFIPLMLDRQRRAFVIDVFYLLARIAALGVGIYVENVFLALALYSVTGVVVNGYLLFWYFSLAVRAEKY